MPITNLFLKWESNDAKFNMALEDIVQKCNHNFEYLQSRENVAQLADTDETHALSFKWNEDEVLLDRTLNLKVHAADRTIDLQGNLTVESASILNQDLTTDATARFAKLGLGMAASNVLDVTGNGNVTGTFGVGGNTALSGTLSAGNSTLGTLGCGTITSTGNIVIQNAGNIGSVGDTDAIAIAADGKVTFTQDFYISMNSDTIHLAHDGTDASMKWSDGVLNLMTDEATNTDTSVYLKGKGTGYGILRAYDQDNAEYLEFLGWSGQGFIRTGGTTPSGLFLMNTVAQDIKCWSDITAGNPSLSLYGWNTAGSDLESTSLTMDDTNDEFLIQSANSANHEGITIDLLETNQAFRLRQNSDYMSFQLDGSDAYMKWSDGNLTLQTDESTNTQTIVEVKGKGTGYGRVRIYDEDDAEYLELFGYSGRGYVRTAGTSPSYLYLQNNVAQDIRCWASITSSNPYFYVYGYDSDASSTKYFRMNVDSNGYAGLRSEERLYVTAGTEGMYLNNDAAANIYCFAGAATGENPYFYVYGYKTGVGNKYLRFRVDSGGEAEIDVQDSGALCYAGSSKLLWGSTGVLVPDDIPVKFGGSSDYSIGHYSTDDEFQIVDGGTLNSNVRLSLNSAGCWFMGETTNAKMTQGLTINQAGNDDEILAFKSSDVGHGFLDFAETDTYGSFKKVSATLGGLHTTGIGTSKQSAVLTGYYVIDNTTTGSGTVIAPIMLDVYKTDGGTGGGAQGAGAWTAAIRTNGATVWGVDEDGDTWQDGSCTADTFLLQTGLTPNIDWLYDVNVDGWITPYMNCLLAFNGDANQWAAAIPEYDIRWKSYDFKWEFHDATPPSPWTYGALNAGTATISYTDDHPGYATIKTRFDGDASDSGYYWMAANDKISIGGLEQADFVFLTAADQDDVRFRLGFQDSITTADPTDGIYVEVAANATFTGVCIENTNKESTDTDYTLVDATWYRARITVSSAASVVSFYLYSEAGTLLFTDTILTAAKIPTGSARAVGFGAVAWHTTDDKLETMLSLDLMDMVCQRGLTR